MASKGRTTSEKVLDEYDIISSQETNNSSPAAEHKKLHQQSEVSETEMDMDECHISTKGRNEQQHAPSTNNSRNRKKDNVKKMQGSVRAVSKVLKPPSINCPEKIVICLDLSAEIESTLFSSRAGDKFSGLELAKQSIKMFVMHKSQMNPNHEFALLGFHDEAVMVHKMTKRVKNLLNTLEDCEMSSQSTEPLNMAQMFETIRESVDLPEIGQNVEKLPPPYIVRVLMVYGRSHSVPEAMDSLAQKELESSPYFFTDVLYIHEPLSEENSCEEVFDALCQLDHREMAYIFEVSRYTPILNCAAKLLAHPLQRPRQLEAAYKIGRALD